MNYTTLLLRAKMQDLSLNKFKNRATFAAHHIMTIGLHQMAVGILRQIKHILFCFSFHKDGWFVGTEFPHVWAACSP
jgi:hypothetical protein